MSNPPHTERWAPPLVTLLTLAVFGALLAVVGTSLRDRIRDQIVERETDLLHTAMAILRDRNAELFDPDDADDPVAQLGVVLEATSFEDAVQSLGDLLAIRLFDREGQLVTTLPPNVTDARLDGEPSAFRPPNQAVGRYHPDLDLSTLFWETHEDGFDRIRAPILEVVLPLRASATAPRAGAAQMFLDGQAVARRFAQLDRDLARQALAAFAAGGTVIGFALGWVFRRLRRANRLLETRTASLLRANHELSLAAKTSAVGAVAAHLIHGIKSPLAGLHQFMANRGNGHNGGAEATGEDDWRDALATTHRMQAIVNEIVRVLGEQSVSRAYEVSLAEAINLMRERCLPLASRAKVELRTECRAEGTLDNRTANLLLLILENLVQNAVEATPPRGRVEAIAVDDGNWVVCSVSDQGPGVSPAKLETLFQPGKSDKPGGTGIGLPISLLLAQHLGARLDLASNTPNGARFSLTLPRSLIDGSIRPAAPRPEETALPS